MAAVTAKSAFSPYFSVTTSLFSPLEHPESMAYSLYSFLRSHSAHIPEHSSVHVCLSS